MKILIKDNVPIYRRGMWACISEAFPAADCHELREPAADPASVLAQQWDLIIFGTMSFQETYLGVHYIRQMAPDTPLIVLEEGQSDLRMDKIAKWNITAYLNKSTAIDQILQHIQRIIGSSTT